MSYLMLIAGLILLFAGSSWFTGAATVGAILALAGGVWIVIALVILAVAVMKA